MQVHLLDPQRPEKAALTCIQTRRPGLEYYVEHHSGRLYILTNAALEEYALMTTAVHQPQMR
jgi:protease II